MKSKNDEDGFVQNTIPTGAYEIEALDKKLKSIFNAEAHFTEAFDPFKIKANFSTLGPITEISPQGPIISFMFDDSIRDLLGFNARTIYEEYYLSTDLVDILSFKEIFHEEDIAKGRIFMGKRSGLIMKIYDVGFAWI